jgi:hypothetical protein
MEHHLTMEVDKFMIDLAYVQALKGHDRKAQGNALGWWA